MKKLVSMLLILVLVISMVACGKSDEGSEASTKSEGEEKVLTVWVSMSLVSEEEQKMKQDDWYISKVAKKFEEENPGVKVELVVVSDQSASHQTFKAAAETNSGPDVANLWSGQSIFAMKDIIMDIKDLVPEEDYENINGWESVTLDFKEGNPVLGYPASGQEVCGFIYNRAVLSEAGLDFDNNPPQSLEEFVEAMEQVKAIGKTPIAASDDGWNGAYFFTFASLWVQANGSERVASNSTGETKFAEDQAFLDSYSFMNELYSKGLINKDYLTIPSVDQFFLEGTSALLCTGNWMVNTAIEALGEENVGFCALPDLNDDVQVKNTAIGGPGQCFVVSKKCKDPELAVKFCSFVDNRENHIELLKTLSKFPIRKDISLEDIGMEGKPVFEQIAELAENYVYWADNSMVPEINAEMQKLGPLVITGKMTPQEMAKKLDQKAAELNK